MSQGVLRSFTRRFLKTIAVVTGLGLLLVGGLGMIVSVREFVVELNNPGPANVNPAVQIVAIAIFCFVTFFAAFLIWIGARRPQQSSNCIAESDGHTAPAVPELGTLIAQCGPQQAGQFHYVVFGMGMLVFALLCFVAPWTFLQPKAGDEKMIGTISMIATGFSGLCGLGMLWKPLLGRGQAIFLYECGLIEQVGSTVRRITFDQIQHLRLQEWHEHRFAPQTFNVKANVHGQKDLSFSSGLRGEAETIIGFLAERVRSVETIPFAY